MSQTKKITSLTEKQKARFPEFVDKWTRIGLNTVPADRPRAEKAIKGLYRLAKLKKPKILWCPCPISGCLVALFIGDLIRKQKFLNSSVKSAVDAGVVSAVASAVGSAVDGAVRSAVRSAVGFEVDGAVDSAVRSEVDSAVRSAVDSAVRSEVDGAVRSAVRSAVESEVDDAVDFAVDSAVGSEVDSAMRSVVGSVVRAAVGSAVNFIAEDAVKSAIQSAVEFSVDGAVEFSVDSIIKSTSNIKLKTEDGYSRYGGSLWPAYAAWADYFNTVLNIKIDRHYLDLVESCGYVWLLNGYAICTERPSEINLDQDGQLHGDGKLAIKYRSGWGLYRTHGVEMPKKYQHLKPELWKSEWLLSEENAQVKRELIRGIGYDKILRDLKAQKLDSWREYKLYEIKGADIEKLILVTMTCPSSGLKHSLRVPPTMTSAREAIKWCNHGIDAEDFVRER